MANITITIKGLDKVLSGFSQYRQQFSQYLKAAGAEASNEILDTRGIRLYPPPGPGNAPPYPYYIRGRGMQETPAYNTGSSERLGTQFYIDVMNDGYRITIGNRASYAKWVIGDEQAPAMSRIGWLKFIDAANQKKEPIRLIYQGWIDKLIKDAGL